MNNSLGILCSLASVEQSIFFIQLRPIEKIDLNRKLGLDLPEEESKIKDLEGGLYFRYTILSSALARELCRKRKRREETADLGSPILWS